MHAHASTVMIDGLAAARFNDAAPKPCKTSLVSRYPPSHGLRSTVLHVVSCYALEQFKLLLRLVLRWLSVQDRAKDISLAPTRSV